MAVLQWKTRPLLEDLSDIHVNPNPNSRPTVAAESNDDTLLVHCLDSRPVKYASISRKILLHSEEDNLKVLAAKRSSHYIMHMRENDPKQRSPVNAGVTR